MAKRKRREKQPRAEAINDIPQVSGDDDSGLEEHDVPSNPKSLIGDQWDTTATEPTSTTNGDPNVGLEQPDDSVQPRKKRKKNKPVHQSGSPETADSNAASIPTPNQPSKSRYILFVGNLPFSATTSSIENHFSALSPGFSVRHSTDKKTGKSRGFAFLEFENEDLIRRCLKGYHHSIFYAKASDRPTTNVKANSAVENEAQDLGVNGIHPSRQRQLDRSETSVYSPQNKRTSRDKGRRINIELTAGGGGGKSTARREKLKTKNEKLDKERVRVRETQMKITEAAERKRRKGGGTGANSGPMGQARTVGAETI